jgi:hypothetical protein
VCIAADLPILGHPVRHGLVVIVDEETPKESLESHLDRISQGFGFKSYKDLPNPTKTKRILRWQRKLLKKLKLLLSQTNRESIKIRWFSRLPTSRVSGIDGVCCSRSAPVDAVELVRCKSV